jgi:beta-lactam-binding protein with PASTA domain
VVAITREPHSNKASSASTAPSASVAASADMPNVLGLKRQTALRALSKAGFVVKVAHDFGNLRPSGHAPGTVVEQRPIPGAVTRRGAIVMLFITDT